MGTVRSFRDLIVWQKSMDLAVQVYGATAKFPREEVFGLTSQMRRAGVSTPSNIAEGQARNSTGEFKHFLGIALGSLAELDTQVELSMRLQFLSKPESEALTASCSEIGKMINGLQRSLPPDH
jgi:four helix bundle protein